MRAYLAVTCHLNFWQNDQDLLHGTIFTLLHAKPKTYGACMFSCNLPPALLAEWPRSFTCYW